VVAVEAGGGDCAVGYRDLPRADHLVARDHAGDGAVADGDQEGFLSNGWQMQNAIYRFRNLDVFRIQVVTFRFQCGDVAGHFWRFTQQDIQRHINWLVVEMAVFQRKMHFFGGFTDDRVRCSFTLANRIELFKLRRRHRQHITFL